MLLGCSAAGVPPRPSGPVALESYEGITTVFFMPRRDQLPTIGAVLLENADIARAATLTGVRLGNPEGLYIESSYVAPIKEDTQAYGFVGSPPVLDENHSQAQYQQESEFWDARSELVGYEMAPGELLNPLIQLGLEDPCGGTADWLEIEYVVDGASYTAVSYIGVEVSPSTFDIDELPPQCVVDHPGTPEE